MNRQIIGQAHFDSSEKAKVIYFERNDMVVIEIGGTSLKLEAINFMVLNEVMRKAAARLVMQTHLKNE